MATDHYCLCCNQPGGEMLHFGNIYIHNTPRCREMASLPVEKHDGNLGAGTNVYHDTRSLRKGRIVRIDGAWAEGANGEDSVGLDPYQALSLRDWLIQESAELERLAKEQDGVTENKKSTSLPPPFLDTSKRPVLDWSDIVGRRAWLTDVHERTKEQ